jgi:hypothetical protein
MPAGSYAGDACGVLRRAYDEHINCGVPIGSIYPFCEIYITEYLQGLQA